MLVDDLLERCELRVSQSAPRPGRHPRLHALARTHFLQVLPPRKMTQSSLQKSGDLQDHDARMVSRSGPRCALVTGAASGLGLETCRFLARTGWKVFGLDVQHRALEAVAEELGPHSFVLLPCNVLHEASVSEAAASFDEAHSDGLDAIIHFAGMHSGGPLMELDEGEFAVPFTVNCIGVWRVQRAFFTALRRRNGRSILVSSEVALAHFTHAFSAAYTASKLALESIASVLRIELACLDPPMDVVVLHLGRFGTPLLRRSPESFRRPRSDYAALLGTAERLASWYTRREGSPAAVAATVHRILSCRVPRRSYAVNVSWSMRLLSVLPTNLMEAILIAGLHVAKCIDDGRLSPRRPVELLLKCVYRAVWSILRYYPG